MQKLCSNGRNPHLQSLLSHHFNTLALYSTSSPTTGAATSSMVDFLVHSLGFTRDKATTTWEKVSSSKMKNTEKPELVIDFFRKRGLDNTQIRKIVSSMPDVLLFKVDKTLEPKFDALEKMGVLASDLAAIIASNPSIIRRGLDTKIAPMIKFVRSVVGNDRENFLRILRRSYWLMSTDVATVLQPNMELFKRYGLSHEKILTLLGCHAELFGCEPKKLERVLVKVEEEIGIPRSSSSFANAVVLLASYNEKTLASKVEIFKRFGWSDLDITTMMRKVPRCLVLSEAALTYRLEFFMNEWGCKPEFLASRPYVLTYSMEARVLPRYAILGALKKRKLMKGNLGLLAAICTSEPLFLDQYVIPYKDEMPEVCQAYISRNKGLSSVEAPC